MKNKIREIGLAGLGLGLTIKEKAAYIGKKLVKKGEANEKRILSSSKEKLRERARFAGKEALVISRKSLRLLEKELKKLEVEAKKTGKVVKKKISAKAKKKKR